MPAAANVRDCLAGSCRAPRAITLDSEASLLENLETAAAVLEAAVETVAKAAEEKEPRPPSKHLVTVCCDALCALSGACVNGSAFQ